MSHCHFDQDGVVKNQHVHKNYLFSYEKCTQNAEGPNLACRWGPNLACQGCQARLSSFSGQKAPNSTEHPVDGRFDECLDALDIVDVCALKMCDLPSEWYFGRLFHYQLCPFSRSSYPRGPCLCSALCLGFVFPAFELHSTGKHSAWRNLSLGETRGPVESSRSARVAGRTSNRTKSSSSGVLRSCHV